MGKKKTPLPQPSSPQRSSIASGSQPPLGAVSCRLPDGDSDMDTFGIGDYETGDIGVEELKAAAQDPNRVRCVAELPPTHSITLKEDLTREEHQRFNNFIGEMFNPNRTPMNQTNDLHPCRSGHCSEHSSMLRQSQSPGPQPRTSNSRLFYRTGEFVDHHGPHGPDTQSCLQR